MTTEEYKELTEIIVDAHLHYNRLSDWEISFLENIEERVDTYKADTYLSDKQWEVLRRIAEKIYV